MASTVVHCVTLGRANGAVILLRPVALQAGCPVRSRVGGDHVLEELVARVIVVCPVGHEMTSLGDTQPAEVVACAVVASSQIFTLIVFIRDVIYLACLTPESIIVWQCNPADSFFKRCWSG